MKVAVPISLIFNVTLRTLEARWEARWFCERLDERLDERLEERSDGVAGVYESDLLLLLLLLALLLLVAHIYTMYVRMLVVVCGYV